MKFITKTSYRESTVPTTEVIESTLRCLIESQFDDLESTCGLLGIEYIVLSHTHSITMLPSGLILLISVITWKNCPKIEAI